MDPRMCPNFEGLKCEAMCRINEIWKWVAQSQTSMIESALKALLFSKSISALIVIKVFTQRNDILMLEFQERPVASR